ncbi:flagellar basal body rod modification protein [Caloramator mitchellensis]|uniref:Flagellar basal body rod modification protein n=1 Tax=Caloramator mitchellensis TaxID=908809 RepID=A0A0R3K0M0_CALMK|nr:flagellar hook capping FlgD N-terminal domain-containing protein [Caloramator mitchellensis]KRQ87054.1 flagellar basal body rod modification protein [Caloramator mitchellensis]
MDITKVFGSNTNLTANKKNDILDKDAFLRILTVQLQNQDPLNAKDNTEYIAQMAQFAALEQSQNLNVNLQKLLVSQKLTEGTLLIGQDVHVNVNDTEIKTNVNGVKLEANEVYIITEDGKFKLDDVVGVGEVSDNK